jgi:hypothetical protein
MSCLVAIAPDSEAPALALQRYQLVIPSCPTNDAYVCSQPIQQLILNIGGKTLSDVLQIWVTLGISNNS